MSSEDIAAVAAAAFLILSGDKKKRRYWVRPSLAHRQLYNLNHLMDDLIRDDTDPTTNELNVTGYSYFKNFSRMSVEDFNYLEEAITPYVKLQDTSFRPAISVREQLGITLRFLATGDSYKSLMYSAKIRNTTIGRFVPRVSKALIEVLVSQKGFHDVLNSGKLTPRDTLVALVVHIQH